MISPPEDVLHKKTEIFNPLVKYTQTSNPKHHDPLMDLHSTHPSCHSFSGRNGTTVLQLELDYSHPTGSRHLSGKLETTLKNLSLRYLQVCPVFYFHRINTLLPSNMVLVSFLCFFFLSYCTFSFSFSKCKHIVSRKDHCMKSKLKWELKENLLCMLNICLVTHRHQSIWLLGSWSEKCRE